LRVCTRKKGHTGKRLKVKKRRSETTAPDPDGAKGDIHSWSGGGSRQALQEKAKSHGVA